MGLRETFASSIAPSLSLSDSTNLMRAWYSSRLNVTFAMSVTAGEPCQSYCGYYQSSGIRLFSTFTDFLFFCS